MGLLALAVAMTGTAYAATELPKNSVGAKQLKKNAVTLPKIKPDVVTRSQADARYLTRGKGDARYLGSKLTFAGPDFEPLDDRTRRALVPNTGGVTMLTAQHNEGEAQRDPPFYLEAKPNLPAGTRIKKVTFLYRFCVHPMDSPPGLGLYLGQYDPAAAKFAYVSNGIVEASDPPDNSCSTVVAKDVFPTQPATISADRRFVVGTSWPYDYGHVNDAPAILLGAKVYYSAP